MYSIQHIEKLAPPPRERDLTLPKQQRDLTLPKQQRKYCEIKRESLNTSVPSPHFQSGSGMLNHIGGTYYHNGLWIIRESQFRNEIVEIVLTQWNFRAGKYIAIDCVA